MWQPIVNADLRRDCWDSIVEIEQALAGELESGARLDPHIAGGTAGLALFFAYLHAAGGSEDAADRTLAALDLSSSALAGRHLLPSLYSGFVGVGWVFTHLTRELFDGDGDLAADVDDALRQLLTDVNEPPPYELIGGLAGYGSYLVERLPNAGAEELVRRIVDVLDASRDATGTWYTNPAWMAPSQRALMPRGCHNLGVAHGIPGVIGFLAAAQRAGLADARLPRLAHQAVQWLLAQKGSWTSSLFPSYIPSGGEPQPTRTAWCYGDLGVAAVLLSAARSFERSDWEEEALAIARVAARRSPDETKVMDTGLCHGAAGIAHLFNRIYQTTDDAASRHAAKAWIRIALDMRQPGEGLAGFLSWVVDSERPDEGEFRGESGFLSGIAGIGLALLAAVTDVEPAWDRVMVVS